MLLKKILLLSLLIFTLISCKKDSDKRIIGEWTGIEEIEIYIEGVLEFENTTALSLEVSRNGSGKLTIHSLNQAPLFWIYSDTEDEVFIDINEHREYEGKYKILENTKETQVWESDESLTYFDLERGETTIRTVQKWILEATK